MIRTCSWVGELSTQQADGLSASRFVVFLLAARQAEENTRILERERAALLAMGIDVSQQYRHHTTPQVTSMLDTFQCLHTVYSV